MVLTHQIIAILPSLLSKISIPTHRLPVCHPLQQLPRAISSSHRCPGHHLQNRCLQRQKIQGPSCCYPFSMLSEHLLLCAHLQLLRVRFLDEVTVCWFGCSDQHLHRVQTHHQKQSNGGAKNNLIYKRIWNLGKNTNRILRRRRVGKVNREHLASPIYWLVE